MGKEVPIPDHKEFVTSCTSGLLTRTYTLAESDWAPDPTRPPLPEVVAAILERANTLDAGDRIDVRGFGSAQIVGKTSSAEGDSPVVVLAAIGPPIRFATVWPDGRGAARYAWLPSQPLWGPAHGVDDPAFQIVDSESYHLMPPLFRADSSWRLASKPLSPVAPGLFEVVVTEGTARSLYWVWTVASGGHVRGGAVRMTARCTAPDGLEMQSAGAASISTFSDDLFWADLVLEPQHWTGYQGVHDEVRPGCRPRAVITLDLGFTVSATTDGTCDEALPARRVFIADDGRLTAEPWN